MGGARRRTSSKNLFSLFYRGYVNFRRDVVYWRAHVGDFVLIAPASVHRRKGRHGSREVAQLGGSPLTRDCGMMGLRAEMKEKERTKRRGVHLAHHIALIQLESLQRQKRCSLQFRVREASKGKVALRL